jgi:phospholipid/cholesterol/gamma-HCH transport system substrate-binding protein
MNKTIEIGVGIFVAIGLAAMFMLALKVSNLASDSSDGFMVKAYFDDVSGLNERAPIRIAGVRVGRVHSIEFDQDRLQAVVMLNIESDFDKISDDSIAAVRTDGLLGAKYVALEPGGSLDSLADGSEIHITSSSMVLEKLINEIVVKLTSD